MTPIGRQRLGGTSSPHLGRAPPLCVAGTRGWRRLRRPSRLLAGTCDDALMETRDAAELMDRLRRSRSVPLLRLVDDAGLDAGRTPEPDPAAVEPYRWLLARVGDGVRLTQAGYLPPAIVTETMRSLGWDADWIGKQNREDQTLPVLLLRDSARRFGLLRTSRGVLLRTVAGRRLTDDPIGLWWHVAERLPPARGEAERVAGLLYLIAVAPRRPRSDIANRRHTRPRRRPAAGARRGATTARSGRR